MNSFDSRHNNNTRRYERELMTIYQDAIREIVALAGGIAPSADGKPFQFDKHPTLKKRLQKWLAGLAGRIEVVVADGVRTEWALANKKNDAMVRQIFGKKVDRLTPEQRRRYFTTNEAARDAFLARKVKGLGLSERVWNYATQYQQEVEMALDLGIADGRAAEDMARDLRRYLREPDRLYRRVRDERGQLHLSKAAAAYHPGAGVYRSSFRNARRMAVTESNIAYKTADFERWQQMSFVVGIEIELSNNHTVKGGDGKPHPLTDICDELAGRYPKDFKFTGWHPHCRCHAITIMKTDEEMDQETAAILRGEEPTGESVNRVADVPEQFKTWIAANEGRIAEAKTLPYFLSDNTGTIVTSLCAARESMTRKEIITNRRIAAEILRQDANYKDVTFNPETGGLKATHVAHNFDPIGGKYELAVQKAGFDSGHAVILGSEKGIEIGKRYTEGTWDGLQFEVMGCETASDNNCLRGLKHASAKGSTEIPILYFPNGGYTEERVLKAIQRYKGLTRDGDEFIDFRRIVCVQDGKVVFNEAYISSREHPLYGHSRKKVREAPNNRYTPRTAKVGNKPEPTKTKEQLLAEQHEKQRLLILERAKKRHDARTKEQEEAIRGDWEYRRRSKEIAEKYISEYKPIAGFSTKAIEEAYAKAKWKDVRKEAMALAQKRRAVIEGGISTLSEAKDYAEVDWSKLATAIKTGNPTKIKKAAKEVSDAVSAMKAEEAALADVIPNVHEWHKQFSLEELKGAHDAIKNGLDKLVGKSLTAQKQWLEDEIVYVENPNKFKPHKIHQTFKISQEAYKAKLESIESQIYVNQVKDALSEVESWSASHPKSLKVAKLLADAKAAIANGDSLESIKLKANNALAEYNKRLAEQSRRNAKKVSSIRFGEECFAESRRNAAVWDKGEGQIADDTLIGTASKVWKGATTTEKDYVYEYTHHYCDVNEPLQGRKYSNSQKRSRFEEKVSAITSYIEKSELPCDMWFTRGDTSMDVIRSRIQFAGGTMPDNLQNLVGMTMQEGGFMSTGSRKGKGFSERPVILNIYAPKGTKAAYIEPISEYGLGGKRNWTGEERYSKFSNEHETLFQRGTMMRITKVYKKGNHIYIDCEVIGQEVKGLSYVPDSNTGY